MMMMNGLTFLCALMTISSSVSGSACEVPLDVLLLQDTTSSYEDDLPNMIRQIPAFLEAVRASNPDSQFAVAQFRDKPIYPLGDIFDFCYKLMTPLTTDSESVLSSYRDLYANGGSDLPEGHYEAVMAAIVDTRVGWRPLKRPVSEGFAAAHIVVMMTDAPPHIPGDITKYGLDPLPDFPGTIDNNDSPNDSCVSYDYPSPDQLRAALRAAGAYLVILTPNEPGVSAPWKWVNDVLLEQPAGFYQYVEEDSSDFIANVMAGIESAVEDACVATLPTEYTIPPTRAPTTPTTTTTTEETTTTTTTEETTTTTTIEESTTTTTIEESTTTTTAAGACDERTDVPCDEVKKALAKILEIVEEEHEAFLLDNKKQ